jgi:NDP-sugar pyrophosphorylase family protein
MTKMPPLALLAGGTAMRMRPLTEQIPKAMLEVAGEPFIAHQLRLMRRQGITRVVFCVGYLWEKIQAFVGDGSKFGISVEYKVDGPQLLGTGGALRKALDSLGPEFLIMYGDSWLDTSFAPIVEAFRASGKPALMTVYRNESQWDRSNVLFADNRIVRYNKQARLPDMRHIDWGLSIVKAEVLRQHPADTAFDLATVFAELSERGELAGFEVTARFYEIGSIEGLRETDAFLRKASHNQSRP